MVRSTAAWWMKSRIVVLGAACWTRMATAAQNGDAVFQSEPTVELSTANGLESTFET